jgi:hypothetical protein
VASQQPNQSWSSATRSCVPPDSGGLGHTLLALGTGRFPPKGNATGTSTSSQTTMHGARGGSGCGHQRPTRRDALQPHAHARGPSRPAPSTQATEPAKLLASAKCCLALAPLGGVLARATLAVFISLRDEHDHNFISFAKKNHSWAYYRTSDASSVDRGWPKIY